MRRSSLKKQARYSKSLLARGRKPWPARLPSTRVILGQGQQECTNLAIIPEGPQGLHKRPLKNEGYPSCNNSGRKCGLVRGIEGRAGARKSLERHVEDFS